MKNIKPKEILISFIVSLLLWTMLSTILQAFKNPNLTQTELFLNIPNSFMLNFK